VEQPHDALERQREAARYLEFAGVMMVVIDRSETVTFVNRKCCEILGYPEEEIVGRNWFDGFLPERLRSEVRSAYQKLIAGELELVEYYENPILTRGGEERIIAWHNTVLRDESDRIVGTLSSGSDVTERRRLARELLEKESLTRLGEMAAVVAHEVRNPLAGISGSLQMISGGLPAGSPHVGVIEEILARIADLNDTIDDLLLYARPAGPQLQPVRMWPILEESISYLKRDPEIGGISVEVGGENLGVMGDPKLLVPVFLNLLLNASSPSSPPATGGRAWGWPRPSASSWRTRVRSRSRARRRGERPS
jgi:PAS domain S-box-containing protein